MTLQSETNFKKAFNIAKKTRLRAYAPYSKFKVGACVVTKSGKIYIGHNIENASFGATICAERAALWNWACQDRTDQISHIILVTNPLATPCGMCLQVLAEFCRSTTPIFLATPTGVKKSFTLNELLPERFDGKSLQS
jgi:cytidine deaminase